MNDTEKKFIGLLKENQRMVHKVCRIYTDNPADHEDLFQEICIQLWKSYPNFRGEAKFTTWMYQICLNTAIALFRKSKRRVQTSEVDFSSLRISSAEFEDDSEKLKSMYAAIHRLSDIERALIMMSWMIKTTVKFLNFWALQKEMHA